MLSAICYRPSVRLSVCPSHGFYKSKTDDVRIMKFLQYGNPIPLVFWGRFHPEILTGTPSGGVKEGRGGENQLFLALSVNISKTAADINVI